MIEAEPAAVPIAVLGSRFDALAVAIEAHDEAAVKTLLFQMLEPDRNRTTAIVTPFDGEVERTAAAARRSSAAATPIAIAS